MGAPSRGERLQYPSRQNWPAASVKPHSAESEGVEIPIRRVALKRIDKVINPRKVPCSLAAFRATPWPALDTPELEDPDRLHDTLQAVIENTDWGKQRDALDVADFMVGIHHLAISLKRQQLHPVWLNQRFPGDNYYLIAGERRVLARIYAGFADIEARVLEGDLAEPEWLRILDEENALAEPLAADEALRIRAWRYRCWCEENPGQVPSVRAFAQHIGVSKSLAHLCLTIIRSPRFEQILEGLREGDIETLREAASLATTDQSAGIVSPSRRPRPDYGLRVGRDTDPRGARIALELALKDLPLPSETRAVIKGCDLTSPSGLRKAWVAYCQALDGLDIHSLEAFEASRGVPRGTP